MSSSQFSIDISPLLSEPPSRSHDSRSNSKELHHPSSSFSNLSLMYEDQSASRADSNRGNSLPFSGLAESSPQEKIEELRHTPPEHENWLDILLVQTNHLNEQDLNARCSNGWSTKQPIPSFNSYKELSKLRSNGEDSMNFSDYSQSSRLKFNTLKLRIDSLLRDVEGWKEEYRQQKREIQHLKKANFDLQAKVVQLTEQLSKENKHDFQLLPQKQHERLLLQRSHEHLNGAIILEGEQQISVEAQIQSYQGQMRHLAVILEGYDYNIDVTKEASSIIVSQENSNEGTNEMEGEDEEVRPGGGQRNVRSHFDKASTKTNYSSRIYQTDPTPASGTT